MIIYEIIAKVRLDLIDEYEQFMKEVHINDLLETEYFKRAEMTRVTDGIYRVRYYVEDRETLEKYFETDVERLREDFNRKFPEGIKVSREILEILYSSD